MDGRRHLQATETRSRLVVVEDGPEVARDDGDELGYGGRRSGIDGIDATVNLLRSKRLLCVHEAVLSTVVHSGGSYGGYNHGGEKDSRRKLLASVVGMTSACKRAWRERGNKEHLTVSLLGALSSGAV